MEDFYLAYSQAPRSVQHMPRRILRQDQLSDDLDRVSRIKKYVDFFARAKSWRTASARPIINRTAHPSGHTIHDFMRFHSR